jgi:hypothetical protein
MEGLLQELIEYNSNGVKKMQEGLLAGAESDFTLGLRLLQRNAESIQTFVPSFTVTQNGLSVPVLPNKAIAQDSDFVALFDRALVLSGNELSDSCIEQKLTAYSGFFLYNFALLTHIRGLPEGNAKRLSQALHMYTLAWQALANTGEANPHVELAVLACISNMAHIHRYFHRMSEVNSCGRWIWERLQQANIPAEERSLLMSNAFFYEQKKSFAAFMA